MMKKKTYQNPTMDIVKVGWKGHLLAGTFEAKRGDIIKQDKQDDWEQP